MGLAKRRKGGETYAEQTDEEQAISEASLNKLVGTSDIYDLKVSYFEKKITKFNFLIAYFFLINIYDKSEVLFDAIFLLNLTGGRAP